MLVHFLYSSSNTTNGVRKIRKSETTRTLIGIEEITEYGIKTQKGEMVYFVIKPSNISVLSESNIEARIYSLMTVMKSISEIEICCLNSRESFEENKTYLKERAEHEENQVVRNLLEEDLKHLDSIQAFSATAREFLIQIRLKGEKQGEIMPYLSRIEKLLSEQGFAAKKADKEDIKQIFAVYFEQNVTTEKFEDYDGERWKI